MFLSGRPGWVTPFLAFGEAVCAGCCWSAGWAAIPWVAAWCT